MVAPTRMNEGAPLEPAAAGGPGPATAGLTQAEAVTEDPAGPAGDLMEIAPAEPAPAEPAAAEPAAAEPAAEETVAAEVAAAEPAATVAVAAEVASAEAVVAAAEAASAEAVVAAAEAVAAEAAPAEPVAAAAKAATPEAATPEAGQAETAPAETETAEAAHAQAAHAQAAHAQAVPAEVVPAEAELSGARWPGPDADQENRAREEGRDVGPLAVVGIIIGVIALVGVAAGVLAMITHGFKPKTVVTYRPAAVFGLRPGQCINSGSSSLSFTLVSCASPHDAEVFANFSLPAAAWPGSAAVRQQAGDGCATKLSGYLNPQLATIGLTQEYVYPNREAWQADQRTVVCEVSAGTGRLTGSVRATH